MNILMIVDDLNIGGTATHVLSISKELLKYKFKVFIVSKMGELDKKFKENSIEIIYFDLDKNLDDISIDIIKIIKENNINLIHTHLIRSIQIAHHIQSFIKIDFVSTLHVLFYDKKTINLLKKAKHIICVSEPIKEMLFEKCTYNLENKASVIYNGIKIENDDIEIYNKDDKQFLELYNIKKSTKKNYQQEIKIITYCSRLNCTKGIICEQFLNVFYELAKENSNTMAIILGSGNKKRNIDFYADYINDSLKRKAVYVMGSVDNPYEYFRISDCVVGTGRVIIESMNVNTSCIAFGSSGFAGIVELKNYKNMLDTYFGEHKKVNLTEKTLAESISYLLYSEVSKDIIYENKNWCCNTFNEEISILKLIKIYKYKNI